MHTHARCDAPQPFPAHGDDTPHACSRWCVPRLAVAAYGEKHSSPGIGYTAAALNCVVPGCGTVFYGAIENECCFLAGAAQLACIFCCFYMYSARVMIDFDSQPFPSGIQAQERLQPVLIAAFAATWCWAAAWSRRKKRTS